jgi:hypothetical protein
LVFDEGTELADIATNENILLLDEYSKVKLRQIPLVNYTNDIRSIYLSDLEDIVVQ